MADAVPAPLKWGLCVLALACAGAVAAWLSILFGAAPLAGLRIEGRPVPASAAALERALNEQAEQWASSELSIRAQDTPGETHVAREALGASLSTATMVRSVHALGRSGNPLLDLGKWWAARRGEIDLRWPPRIDGARLARFVE